MNTVDILNQYLQAAERRLKMFALSRGAAVTALLALGLTVALCVVANAFTFAPGIVLAARLLLFLALAVAIAFGAVLPLLRLNRRNAARRMEQRYPEFEQRLLTFAERREPGNPFFALLADETAEVARKAEPGRVAPARALMTWLLSGAGAACVLIWLIVAGPGYLGHGASLLWAGPAKTGAASLYNIVVTPGDQTVRRKSDQLITAKLVGFDTKHVRLMAKFNGTSKWEEVQMSPQPGGDGYEFLFAALPDSVDYYVEARGIRSASHNLRVIDLPGIKNFKVTYKYPGWTGMKDATEDPGGDLRAVEGTVAEITVKTDAPLRSALIATDDGQRIQLSGEGTTLTAQVPIRKDGMYHFAAMDRDKPVRLSEDYFIEARPDNPPAVKMTRPGRDAKVSPIEEVALAVEAEDDFGLQDVQLHYSVNGGEERTVGVLARKGTKQAQGKSLLALEDFKLAPGDIVSVYATARDARNTSKTDIFFIEAQPFEREYSQSQQGGGGGGGGDEQEGKIGARQKEIIAATWNEMKSRNTAAQTAENARFLTDVQSKLRDQAASMSQRAKSRALAGVNQQFQSFVKSMDEAVKEMSAAAGKLKSQSWKEALPMEQRALQHALRAEATFREIQVAFGQQGGGGGGGGAARDLDNLFDLELDTEKNQYETGQQTASSEQRQKDVDEALQKLEQLARRQQELAKQQQNQKQQTFQQRWEQEQLRREAEELRKKMEQLSRGEQQSASSQSQSQSQQGGSSSSSSSSSPSQQGSQAQQQQARNQQQQNQQNQRMRSLTGQSPSDQRLKQAFDRLSQASEDMRQAASAGEQGNAGTRRAAERLQEAKDMLRGMRQQQSSNQLDDLSQRADELASQQREFTNKMRRAYGNAGQQAPGQTQAPGQQPAWPEVQQLASEKDKMAGALENLERDTQKAARDLAGSQPAASSKLRQGLGELQQDEVRLRMKFSSQWIRQGRGSLLVPGEAVSAMALDKLSEAIKDAKKAMGSDAGGKQGDSETERALARVEKLREQLERAAAGQRGQQGGQQQGGQQQGGQQQGGQQQGGQQQGGQQQGGQQGGSQRAQNGGVRGGDTDGGRGAINRGNLQDRGETPGNRTGDVNAERAMREAVRDLSQLRQAFGANSELGREISDVLHDIQKSDYALQGPALEGRLQREILPAIEQLEMQLRRKVEGDSAATRTPSADKIPAGYSEKVAEYFRRLSKSK